MATEILTTRAVADQFGVTPSAVSRWVHSDKLRPFTKVPGLTGAYLFTRDEVDRFARERDDCNRGESFEDRTERDTDAERHRRLAHVEAPEGIDA